MYYIIFYWISLYQIFNFIKIERKLMNFFLSLLIFFIILLEGFRDLGVGTDSYSYYYYFTGYYKLNFGFLYSLLVSFVKMISSNYIIMQLLQAIFVNCTIFYMYQKKYKLPLVSMIIIYAYLIPLLGSNRSLLALSIIIFSLQYIYKKDKKYFFFVFLAFLFHKTSIITIIFYFLYGDKKINNKKLIIITLLIFVLGLGIFKIKNIILIYQSSEYFRSRLNRYIIKENISWLVIFMGVIKRIIPLIFTVYIYKHYKKNKKLDKIFTFLFYLNYIGLNIYILFYKNFLVMVSRGNMFFEILAFPLLVGVTYKSLKLKKSSLIRISYIILIVLLSYYNFERGIATYPELFIPYRSDILNISL